MLHDQWQQYLDGAADPAHDAGPPGIAWLSELAAVRFEGSNAREFLQGYLTTDTGLLQAGTLTPTALCNLKGRVVVNGWCAPDGDEDVLMIVHRTLVDTLAAFLKPYLMFSRHTTFADLQGQALVLGGLDLMDDEGLALDARRRLFVVTTLEQAQALWERHPHVGEPAWLAALAADGFPLLSGPVSGVFLPQMLNLDSLGAVDFRKGCYLGQEVVARAQHRGQVKRRLTRLLWEGAEAPEPGAEVMDESGRAQGVVVQSARHGRAGGAALAVLRSEAPDALRLAETMLTKAS